MASWKLEHHGEGWTSECSDDLAVMSTSTWGTSE